MKGKNRGVIHDCYYDHPHLLLYWAALKANSQFPTIAGWCEAINKNRKYANADSPLVLVVDFFHKYKT